MAGRLSPNQPPLSFAQTGEEFNLESDAFSDAEDLRSEVGGSEAFELTPRRSSDEEGAELPGDQPPGAVLWETGVSVGRSGGSTASYELYTPDEELAVRSKFDRRLVVFVALLYMLSFLDRSSMWILKARSCVSV